MLAEMVWIGQRSKPRIIPVSIAGLYTLVGSHAFMASVVRHSLASHYAPLRVAASNTRRELTLFFCGYPLALCFFSCASLAPLPSL